MSEHKSYNLEVGSNLASIGKPVAYGYAIKSIVEAITGFLLVFLFVMVFLYGMYKGEIAVKKQAFVNEKYVDEKYVDEKYVSEKFTTDPTFTQWLLKKYNSNEKYTTEPTFTQWLAKKYDAL